MLAKNLKNEKKSSGYKQAILNDDSIAKDELTNQNELELLNENSLEDNDVESSSKALSLSIPSNDACLANYIKKINSFPILTYEQEMNLRDKFYGNGDKEAGNQIFLSHLRLVVKIAFGFKKYLDNMQELIAEGNIGLLKALKKFDVTKNVRFATYAMMWIRASIQEYVFKNKSIVPIATNSNQKNIIYHGHKEFEQKDIFANNALPTKKITTKGFEIDIVATDNKNALKSNQNQMIYQRSKYSDIAIDESEFDSISSQEPTTISDSIDTPEEYYAKKASGLSNNLILYKAIDSLDERSRFVIKNRFLTDTKLTLSEISKKIGVSIERVRQIEESAMEKIKTLIQNN